MTETPITDRTVSNLAEVIREIDGANKMSPTDLGARLASRLIAFYGDDELYAHDVIAFVERTNPDKRLGAGALAELIVAEFDLDEVA
jgi:hypothetical protein